MLMHGKTAIVTGAASGIGKAISEYLYSIGTQVIIIDINNESLSVLPDVFHKVQADISDAEKILCVMQEVSAKFGAIDLLINCAGQIHSEPLVNLFSLSNKKHSVDNWNNVIRNNLHSVFNMTVNVAENMLSARRKGIIINFSSVSANGNAGQCAYSAAKAGVIGFTKSIAKELGPLGIRAVVIAPGFIDTKSTQSALDEKTLQDWVKNTPLRKLGLTQDIVETIKYILANDYLTGCVLSVDGGIVV